MQNLKIQGKYTIEVTPYCGTTEVFEIQNVVPTVGKQAVAKVLSETANTSNFQYIAFGTGTTSPTSSDNTLLGEVGRKSVETLTCSGTLVNATCTLTNQDLVGHTLNEIGVFGIAATGVLDSGEMLSRAIITPAVVKTNTNSVSITYTLSIG